LHYNLIGCLKTTGVLMLAKIIRFDWLSWLEYARKI